MLHYAGGGKTEMLWWWPQAVESHIAVSKTCHVQTNMCFFPAAAAAFHRFPSPTVTLRLTD